jgi:hypothetical protein
MPTSFAWLCLVGREVRVPGQQLATLLNEDMREMVIAHPQLARLVRPVLRMTGEQVPVWFPKPPKRVRTKRPACPARRKDRPVENVAAEDPSGALIRFIEAARVREYAAAMERLYPGWIRRQATAAATTPAPTPPPPPAPAPAAAAIDRDRYYYAETWNGKLIPVRRRWG